MRRLDDLTDYLFAPETPVREVLERFNALSRQMALVVDGERRLLGTVTDGDIRRSILVGVALEEPISRCMHKTPLTIIDGESLPAEASEFEFVPALDDRGSISAVLLPQDTGRPDGSCLIMAGGYGTRLGDMTRDQPKPLLPLAGRPILDHILEGLENSGYRQAFVSVHYLADQIKRFAGERQGDCEVMLLHEEDKLGTAGALGLLPEEAEMPLVVINGDLVTQVDFAALRDFHLRHGHDATISVARYEAKIPYGVVRYSEDGLFRGIDEKPVFNHFVAAGIYCLSRAVLNLVPRGRTVDMPELLNEAHSLGLRVRLFPIHEYWMDIGLPTDLESARRDHDGTNPKRPPRAGLKEA